MGVIGVCRLDVVDLDCELLQKLPLNLVVQVLARNYLFKRSSQLTRGFLNVATHFGYVLFDLVHFRSHVFNGVQLLGCGSIRNV